VGVPLPTGGDAWEGVCPLPIIFLNFYIKIVSFRAFWVAISYRLANCFTRIGNTLGIEMYWRSCSSILGTRPIITPSVKLHAKK